MKTSAADNQLVLPMAGYPDNTTTAPQTPAPIGWADDMYRKDSDNLRRICSTDIEQVHH